MSIINTRLEVGRGDVGENVPPEAREEAESVSERDLRESQKLFKRLMNTHASPPLTC